MKQKRSGGRAARILKRKTSIETTASTATRNIPTMAVFNGPSLDKLEAHADMDPNHSEVMTKQGMKPGDPSGNGFISTNFTSDVNLTVGKSPGILKPA